MTSRLDTTRRLPIDGHCADSLVDARRYGPGCVALNVVGLAPTFGLGGLAFPGLARSLGRTART